MNATKNLESGYDLLYQKFIDSVRNNNPEKLLNVLKNQHSKSEYTKVLESYLKSQKQNIPDSFELFEKSATENKKEVNQLLGKFLHSLKFHHPFESNFCDSLNSKMKERTRLINNPESFIAFMKKHVNGLLDFQIEDSSESAEHRVYLQNLLSKLESVILNPNDASTVLYDDKSDLLFEKIYRKKRDNFRGLEEEDFAFLFNSLLAKYRVNRKLKRLRCLTELVPLSLELKILIPTECEKLFVKPSQIPAFSSFKIPIHKITLIEEINSNIHNFHEISECKIEQVSQFIFQLDKYYSKEFQSQSDIFNFPLYDSELMFTEEDEEDPEGFIQKEKLFANKPKIKSCNNISEIFIKSDPLPFENELRSFPIKSTFPVYEWVRILLSSKIEETESYIERRASKQGLDDEFLYKSLLRILILKNRGQLWMVFEILNAMREIQMQINTFIKPFVSTLSDPAGLKEEISSNETLCHLEEFNSKKGYKNFSLLSFLDENRAPVSFQRTNPCYTAERNLNKSALLKKIVGINCKESETNSIFLDPLRIIDSRGFSIIHETAISDFLEFIGTIKDYLNLYISRDPFYSEDDYNYEKAFMEMTSCEYQFLNEKFKFLQQLLNLLSKVRGVSVKKALIQFICEIQARRPNIPIFESDFQESYYLAIQALMENTRLLIELQERQNIYINECEKESVESNSKMTYKLLYPASYDKLACIFLDIQKEMEAFHSKDLKLSHLQRIQTETLFIRETRWLWSSLCDNYEIFDELSEVSSMDCDMLTRSTNFFEFFKCELGTQIKEKRSKVHIVQTSLKETTAKLKDDFLINKDTLLETLLNLTELLRKREKMLTLLYSIAYMFSIYNTQASVLVPTRSPITIHSLLTLDRFMITTSYSDLSSWMTVLSRPKKFREFQLYFQSAVMTKELFTVAILQNMFLVEDNFRLLPKTTISTKTKNFTQTAVKKFGINKFPQKIPFVDIQTLKRKVMVSAETLIRVAASKAENKIIENKGDHSQDELKKLTFAMKKFDMVIENKKTSIDEVMTFVKLLNKEIHFETLKVQTMMMRKKLFGLQKNIPLKNAIFTETFFPIFDEFGYATNIFNLPSFFSIFEYTHDDFDVEIISDLKEKSEAVEAIKRAQNVKGDLRGSSKVRKLKKSQNDLRVYSRKKFFDDPSLAFLEKTNLFLVHRYMTLVYGLMQIQFIHNSMESYVEDILLMRHGLLKKESVLITSVEEIPPYKLQEIRLRNTLEQFEVYFDKIKTGLEKFKSDSRIVNVNEAIMVFLQKKLNVSYSSLILLLFRMYDTSDRMVSTNFISFIKTLSFPAISKLTANNTSLRLYDVNTSGKSIIEGMLSEIFINKGWSIDYRSLPRFSNSLFYKYFNILETSFLLLSKSERTSLSTLSSELNGEVNDYANKRNVFESKDSFLFLKKTSKFLNQNLRLKIQLEALLIIHKGRNAFERLGLESLPESVPVQHIPAFVISKKEFVQNSTHLLDFLESMILNERAYNLAQDSKQLLPFSIFSFLGAFLNILYNSPTVLSTEFRNDIGPGVAILSEAFFSQLSNFNEIIIKKFLDDISREFKQISDEFISIEEENIILERNRALISYQEKQIEVITKDVVIGRVGHKAPLTLLELDDLQEKVECLKDQQEIQGHFLRQKLQESYFSTIRDLKFKQNNLSASFIEYKMDMSMTAKHFMANTEKEFVKKVSHKANEVQGKFQGPRLTNRGGTSGNENRVNRFSTIYPEEELHLTGIENNPLIIMYRFIKKQRTLYQLKDIQMREDFEREMIKKKESLTESDNLRRNISELEQKGMNMEVELSDAQKKEIFILKKNNVLRNDLNHSEINNKKLKKTNLEFIRKTDALIDKIENIKSKKTLRIGKSPIK